MANGKDESAQYARFVKTFRVLGCDEDEAASDENLKVLARQKPKESEAAEKSKASRVGWQTWLKQSCHPISKLSVRYSGF